jgi:hypothetical protein
MSFNDLERGTGSPAPERGQGGLNGQSYGRNTNRSNRGGARGPLPLYHAPPSSSSSANNAADSSTASNNAEWKKIADRIGIQIFKLNSNVQGIDKLMELQVKKMHSARGSQAKTGDKDWMGQM